MIGGEISGSRRGWGGKYRAKNVALQNTEKSDAFRLHDCKMLISCSVDDARRAGVWCSG